MLSVLLIADIHGESTRLGALTSALRTRGHDALLCQDADAALAQATPDVLVIDAGAPASASANLAITSAFRAPGATLRILAIFASEDYSACRAALQAGASDVFAGPFSIDDIVDSVEFKSGAESAPALAPSPTLHRAFDSDSDGQEALCRELLAFATRVGVGRSHRFRIATAAGELASNAALHAYDDGAGPLLLSAAFDGANMSVEIRDLGPGFSTAGAALGQADMCRGLDFVRSLAERVDIDSSSAGTKVTCEFSLTPTHFDEEPASAEHLDYLTPAATRRFLDPSTMRDDEFKSSALATTVGRILLASVSIDSARTQTALWS
jgi:anti-sigma regulatory factor (Ser/Thr protein kinase)/ActR/RegA family two-component response regulator